MSPYGGDKEARTLDPLLAKQVLSQLSYTPALFQRFGFRCPYALEELIRSLDRRLFGGCRFWNRLAFRSVGCCTRFRVSRIIDSRAASPSKLNNPESRSPVREHQDQPDLHV